jgi:hypothetical protein
MGHPWTHNEDGPAGLLVRIAKPQSMPGKASWQTSAKSRMKP